MKLGVLVDKSVYIEYKTAMAPEEFQLFMAAFLEYFADIIIKRIKEVVRRQLYNWDPLSDAWKNFKKRMGLSPRIWYASGQIVESIEYKYYPLGDVYYIQVPTAKKHNVYKKRGIGSGLTKTRLIDIIRYMEYGTSNMPARPLFVPVFREFSSKRIQEKIYQEFVLQYKGSVIF